MVGMDKVLVLTAKARGESPSCNGLSFLISVAVVLQMPSVISGPVASVFPKNLLEIKISGAQQTVFEQLQGILMAAKVRETPL